MRKVTWRRFDQSAKQLVVGQTTITSDRLLIIYSASIIKQKSFKNTTNYTVNITVLLIKSKIMTTSVNGLAISDMGVGCASRPLKADWVYTTDASGRDVVIISSRQQVSKLIR